MKTLSTKFVASLSADLNRPGNLLMVSLSHREFRQWHIPTISPGVGGVSKAVYASEVGVVVFSAWSNGGYRNAIMIGHGNGY